MSTGLANWREIGAPVIMACINRLVALTLICLSLFLVIAVSVLARGARASAPMIRSSETRGSRVNEKSGHDVQAHGRRPSS
jgi:hypothetical protein